MEQIDQQIAHIKEELENDPTNADLLNELGIGYHIRGNYDKALEAFQKSLTENAQNAQTHFNMANTFVQQRQMDAAANHYLDALDIKPDYVPALNNLADLYEMADEEESARELFEYITQLKPEDAMGYFNLANHLLRTHNTLEAGKNYKKAIERDPQFHEAYNNIGLILKHLHEYEDAIPYYEQCLEIAPDYKPAQKDLKECREKAKNI